jgi:hypothetical protein
MKFSLVTVKWILYRDSVGRAGRKWLSRTHQTQLTTYSLGDWQSQAPAHAAACKSHQWQNAKTRRRRIFKQRRNTAKYIETMQNCQLTSFSVPNNCNASSIGCWCFTKYIGKKKNIKLLLGFINWWNSSTSMWDQLRWILYRASGFILRQLNTFSLWFKDEQKHQQNEL